MTKPNRFICFVIGAGFVVAVNAALYANRPIEKPVSITVIANKQGQLRLVVMDSTPETKYEMRFINCRFDSTWDAVTVTDHK